MTSSTSRTGGRGPVLIDLEEDAQAPRPRHAPDPAGDPASAPAIPETDTAEGAALPRNKAAMEHVAVLAARRRSLLGRLFWGAAATLLSFAVSVAAFDFVQEMLSRSPVLGWAAMTLLAVMLLALLGLALRELAALARLGRVDEIRKAADHALASQELKEARAATARLLRFYAGREDVAWGRQRFEERRADVFDAGALIDLAETELLAPLDARARREVEAAARQVALVTAVVPLALADVVAALTANLRMIRRIAEIYGGRAGTLGSWRLTRTVFTHLVATGAVAVGDDMISSVAGGGLLAKLSRRFGEGIVNGALTARVGVAAIEVCRPLPMTRRHRPSVTGLVQRALTGLFGKD
jgi:putative membrane protein